MAIVSTNVGPGQTVTTFAAWMATLPANIVTSGNSYVCNVIGTLTDTGGQTLVGHTTDATHTITVTAAPGQSFVDNANRLTNALAYNSANGACWEAAISHASLFGITDQYVIVSRMQFKATGAVNGVVWWNSGSGNGTLIQCIMQGEARNQAEVVKLTGPNTIASNCLIVSMTAAGHGTTENNVVTAMNLTIVRPSDLTGGSGDFSTRASYGTSTIRNCALFGFNNNGAANSAADGHNCTDKTAAAGSTGNVVNQVFANQFVGTLSTAQDWRLKSGSGAINVAVTDTTNLPTSDDIVGTARTGAWDIGCWEFASGAAPANMKPRIVTWQA